MATIKGIFGYPKARVITLWRSQKNSMWILWGGASKTLRQEETVHTGSFMRRCQDIFGSGSATGIVPEMHESEAGRAEVACNAPLLHEAICVSCREKVSQHDREGCGQRVEVGLAYSKDIGKGIDVGAASAKSCCWASDNRNRRTIASKGSYLPDSGKRSATGPAYLVWRRGPVCGEPGYVLPVA